jgi:ABC-type transporter Mla subunit MlaD
MWKDLKGNTHWQMYATIELFEMLTKRLDDVMRLSQTSTSNALAGNTNLLNGISKQLKLAETNLRAATLKSGETLLKSAKQTAQRINKIREDLDAFRKEFVAQSNAIRAELERQGDAVRAETQQMTETLKQFLTNGWDGILQSLRSEAASIKEALTVAREEHSSLTAEIQEARGSLSRQSAEEAKALTNQLDSALERINTVSDRMDGHLETLTNILDDQQSNIVSEIQQAVGTLGKQGEEQTDALRESLRDLSSRIDALAESTSKQFVEMQRSLEERIDSAHEAARKHLDKEIAELRDVLSGMRSDIEMQKHVMLQAIGSSKK